MDQLSAWTSANPSVIQLPASEFASGAERKSGFGEAWGAIKQHKWPILGAGIGAAILATIVVSLMTPIYRSTAGVLIEPNKAKLVSIDEIYGGVTGGGRENFQTQAELLRSRSVSNRVIDELKLDTLPEFASVGVLDAAKTFLARWLLLSSAEDDALTRRAEVERRFASKLSIDPVLLSNVIKVSFESSDPSLSAAVANGMIEAFVQADLDNRYRITESATRWMQQRMRDLKTKLDTSEKSLQQFRDVEGLLDNKSTLLSGRGKQLEELSQKLVEARVRRSEAEEAYNQIKAGERQNYESSPAVVRNPTVQRAREAEAAAERRIAEVSDSFGPAHPAYIAAKSDLAAARANVERQTQVIVNSVLKEFNAAKATERTIEEALNKSKGSIQTLNRKEIEVSALEREVDTNRRLYETFLSRYKEASATSDLQVANARLVDMAVPSPVPVKPAKGMLVFSAAILGVLAAIGVTLGMRRLNNTVKRLSDVEEKLGQPLLTALPTLPTLAGKRGQAAFREVLENPDSLYSEAIRTAGTGILLSSLDSRRRVIAITSSVAGEGKSTFAVNLSMSLAEGRSVVLIDADLRRPTLAAALGLPTSSRKAPSTVEAAPAVPAKTAVASEPAQGVEVTSAVDEAAVAMAAEAARSTDSNARDELSSADPQSGESPADVPAAAPLAEEESSDVTVAAQVSESYSAEVEPPQPEPPKPVYGLTDLIANSCTTDQVLRGIEGSNLKCIVAGKLPRNPLPVLGSKRFAEIVDQLADQFDVVVIDCPPLQLVSDALVIGRKASGVVYTVQASETPVTLVSAGIKRIVAASVPILGVVVNRHDFENAERYYGEYTGYSKYGKYGYSADAVAG